MVYRNPIRSMVSLLTALMMSGCGFYSFTGTSISPDVKTAQVNNFANYAGIVNPTLTQRLLNKLQDKLVNQTVLNITNEDGDLVYDGEITEYKITPSSIQSSDVAANNKLTISVKIRYTNTLDKKQNVEKTFSNFDFFDGNASLTSSLEEELTDKILDKIVDNIFNGTLGNW